MLVVQGNFIGVASGKGHSCAVKTDGQVECWGSNEHTGLQKEMTGNANPAYVINISKSSPFVFLLTLPLQLMGYLRYHQCDSPDAQFSQVACGAAHTCALSVAPWHSNA